MSRPASRVRVPRQGASAMHPRWPKLSPQQLQCLLRVEAAGEAGLPANRGATVYSLCGYVKMLGVRRNPLVEKRDGQLFLTAAGAAALHSLRAAGSCPADRPPADLPSRNDGGR